MVELLSPAGEYRSFVGAISAGADAVYLAGNMYGARASAVNFTAEEIISAIHYAHLFNRKVYLTVNTLTKNEELDKLYDFLRPLYLSGLDGVIVQDIGVILYIKEFFKDLEIHVSTQAAVTSVYGADFYDELGASRVVLARELTLNEIKKINETGIQTECFIHGAMCYSYSGLCLFSSFLGGNSGNRGRCKGPCRQPYKINNKEAYYLSLADMNTLDVIDKLIDSGIYSFKIEGRLKSPSYAAGVTSVYRKYIDFCLENPGKPLIVSEEDRNLLNFLYSRTKSGHGYYFSPSSKKMVTLDKGAYNKVDEDLERKIIEKYIDDPVKKEIGFTFEGSCGDYAGLTAYTTINGKRFETHALSDNRIEKAVKEPTSENDILRQLKKLGNTCFVLKECNITINDGFIPSSMLNNLRRQVSDSLTEQINNSDNERTLFEECINNSDNCNVLSEGNDHKLENNDLLSDKNSTGSVKDLRNIAFVKSLELLNEAIKSDFYDAVVVSSKLAEDKEFRSIIEKNNKDLYIELPPVIRALNEQDFSETVKFANESDFIKGVFVNQYDQYNFLKLCGFTEKSAGFEKEICAGFNVYNYNDTASGFNEELFDLRFIGAELSIKDIDDMNINKACVMVYGRAPLMYTANCVMKTTDRCSKYSDTKTDSFINLKDRIGMDFKVKLSCSDSLCFNTIYNSKPTSLHKYLEHFKKIGLNCFAYSFTDENTETFKLVTNYYKNVQNGNFSEPPFEFTAYHMKNGVL